jgi:hypothetical protein
MFKDLLTISHFRWILSQAVLGRDFPKPSCLTLLLAATAQPCHITQSHQEYTLEGALLLTSGEGAIEVSNVRGSASQDKMLTMIKLSRNPNPMKGIPVAMPSFQSVPTSGAIFFVSTVVRSIGPGSLPSLRNQPHTHQPSTIWHALMTPAIKETPLVKWFKRRGEKGAKY